MVDEVRRAVVREITWFNAAAKLLGYASVFAIADTLVPQLYGSLVYAAITVAVLTLIGLMADLVIVPILGNIWSLVVGYPAMVLLTWFVASWSVSNHVTLVDAMVVALFLGPWEYFLHRIVLGAVGRRIPR